MNNIDYTIFYKENFDSVEKISSKYNLFISAYNDSRRVKDVFYGINADKKHWLIFPEYNYTQEELPLNDIVFSFSSEKRENDILIEYISSIGEEIFQNESICIDITGFIRPHLVFLVRYLAELNLNNIDFLYTDPISYTEGEKTKFSGDSSVLSRIIEGCAGIPESTTDDNDILIVGAGYDEKRIKDITILKSKAKLVQLFGFPSLKADMYQENILRVANIIESSGDFKNTNSTILAPANDPFITAQQIHEFVKRENSRKPITNLYLSPLSTKAHTLGFILYYITECIDSNVSIIFPFSTSYTRETTTGISKIWIYTVEFDTLQKWRGIM